MGNKKIGFDIDGVLAEFYQEVLRLHNQKYKTNILSEEVTTFNFSNLGINYKEFESDGFYVGLKTNVEIGMRLFYHKLCGDDIFLVTARPKKFALATMEWVDCHFGYLPVRLVKDKSKEIKGLGIEEMWEDCVEQVINIANGNP